MEFVIQSDRAPEVQSDYPIAPPGVHRMRIVSAEETTNRFKACDDNPDGVVLALRLAVVAGKFSFVFHDIPQHMGWMAEQLSRSLGNVVAGGTVSLNPDDLIDAELTAEISHYTGKQSGKTKAVIKRYVPAEASSRPAGSRPAHVKAAPAGAVETATAKPGRGRPAKPVTVEDDIPF